MWTFIREASFCCGWWVTVTIVKVQRKETVEWALSSTGDTNPTLQGSHLRRRCKDPKSLGQQGTVKLLQTQQATAYRNSYRHVKQKPWSIPKSKPVKMPGLGWGSQSSTPWQRSYPHWGLSGVSVLSPNRLAYVHCKSPSTSPSRCVEVRGQRVCGSQFSFHRVSPGDCTQVFRLSSIFTLRANLPALNLTYTPTSSLFTIVISVPETMPHFLFEALWWLWDIIMF